MQFSHNKTASVQSFQELSNSSITSISSETSENIGGFVQSLIEFPSRVDISENINKNSIKNIHYLSEGSSAKVFTGFLNGEKVAIKISSQRENECAEVELEHRLLERLCHPNIVQIRGAGYCSSKFIVLEYIDGGSLSDVMEKRRIITLPKKRSFFSLFNCKVAPASTPVIIAMREVIPIALQIAQALEYLHESWHPNATIIHRDLKPQNIVLSSTGVVKLIDFGLMTCVKKRTNMSETYQMTGFVGSLRYMAPEVVKHKPYNEKVDIYSFGMILWELSTGNVPFDSMTRETYMEKVVNGGFRPNLKGIHPAMAELISRCWDSDFLCRPSSKEIIAKLYTMKNHLR